MRSGQRRRWPDHLRLPATRAGGGRRARAPLRRGGGGSGETEAHQEGLSTAEGRREGGGGEQTSLWHTRRRAAA
jgi:hypothetical protein